MSNKLIIIQTAYAIATVQFGDSCFTKKWKKYRTIAQRIGIYIFKITQKNPSYRDIEDDLYGWSDVREILGLTRIPDYSTIDRNIAKITEDMIALLNDIIVEAMAECNCWIGASDTTWLQNDNASKYFDKRSGKQRKKFRKLGITVDINSRLITWFCVGNWPSTDIPYGEILLEKSKQRTHLHLMDMWFDGWKNLEHIVPPIPRWGCIKAPNRIERQKEVILCKEIGLFGYRWIVETAYSVMKRKFSSYIREKRLDSQNSTLALFTLAYNLHIY
jgi:hypothetical protein